jgi:PIN domain nuclease of toxin-antitoxin system
MSKIVLDASAILAFLNEEPGYEKLTPELLAHSIASTVNLAEVQTKLVARGGSPDEAWEDARSPVREILPFTEEHAQLAGSLVTRTRRLGLSLGDRACLALGIVLNVPIYTAERAWKELKLNVPIHILR